MNYTLAVFKTRHASLRFANLLRENNIPVAIVNTPYEIGNVCGISVKFLYDFLFYAKRIIMQRDFVYNFDGFYAMYANGRWGRLNE